jgi:hypothetical protein
VCARIEEELLERRELVLEMIDPGVEVVELTDDLRVLLRVPRVSVRMSSRIALCFVCDLADAGHVPACLSCGWVTETSPAVASPARRGARESGA